MSVRNVFLIAWVLSTAFFEHEIGSLPVSAVMGLLPAMIVGGARWAMLRGRGQRRKTGARGSAPLTVTPQDDGWAVIDVNPAPLPSVFTVLPVLARFVAVIAVGNLGGPWRSLAAMLTSMAIAWALVGGLLAVFVRAFQNSRRQVQATPFAVRADAVRLPDGTEVAVGRIYSLTMRNALDGHVALVVTNSTIGGLGSIRSAHAAKQLAVVAYRVDLDHDGRSSALSGGLTEPQARAVAAEVLRLMPALE
ncbi:hypothetical protein [Dyella sp. 333MFSha]|uniref:hypothetical protein n=1 Tax=Dyella sp. 333MFSha TaxID=1798240 RepID=UPI000B86A7B2|nr:hypothetical protein [Dyella sp. 333MFSha]